MKKQDPIQWKVERWKIKDLKGFPNNPRVLSKHMHQELRKSLEEDGNHGVLKINTDGTIIGGNQRAAILKKLGEKEVDVKVPNRRLSDLEAQRINIRDNKVHAEFDFEMLANEYDPSLLIDSGFTPEEMGGFDPDKQDPCVGDDPVDEAEIMVTFTIKIPNAEASSFENQLDELVNKFPTANKERK